MIRRIILLVAINLGIVFTSKSSGFDKLQQIDTVYSFTEVDTMPEPEKGMKELYKKWSMSVRYPADARRKGIEGKVFIYIILNESGTIIETGIEQGLGYGCDEAALESFKKTNLIWKSGKKDGKNVKVKMVIPFIFKLG